jgi:hypothetical protein
MGLLAGFAALAGLLGGLGLLVLWAGALERWVDGQEEATDRLDTLMSGMEPYAAVDGESEPTPTEAEPFAYPPAA